MRTQEALGYIVSLAKFRTRQTERVNIIGSTILVCNDVNSNSTSTVSGKISAFWRFVAPRVLASSQTKLFQTSVGTFCEMKIASI
ncbi:unnamed protein product [Protopolystoma xenopodis]|uniref:Uncharacterized protein n=1 Tax=Protopolystoma xenopodis TaxID=117903 RepID=A0A3S5A7L0_9PLAT|nr:unnamed protein product [Protopolystoma xenopodis]